MLRSTHRGGLTYPQLACDTCELPIERPQDAIVQIFLDGRIRVVHGHGSDCDDRRNDGGWMPLEMFLHCLLRGWGFDADQAKVETKRWARLR